MEKDQKNILFNHADRILADFSESDKSSSHERISNHAERVANLVKRYAGELVPEEVYQAALLHDIAQQANSEYGNICRHTIDRDSDFAMESLIRHVSSIPTEFPASKKIESLKYTYTLLNDVSVIERAAMNYDRFSNGDVVDMSQEDWMINEPEIDIEHLREISENVNIESIIIKAAANIDDLEHPARDERKLMNDIFQAESFYGPLCEILGLDAMSAKMRSSAFYQRAIHTGGFEDAYKKSSEIIEKALKFDPNEVIEDVFNGQMTNTFRLSGDDFEPSEEKIIFGAGKLITKEADSRYTYRVKSLGSLAKKLKKHEKNGNSEKQTPMDVLGVTVVSNSRTDSMESFAATLQNLIDGDDYELKPAPSKDRAGYVSGAENYIQAAQTVLLRHDIDADLVHFNTQDSEDVFQVAKMTFIYKDALPVEIQFLTEEDRQQARIGHASHVAYKQAHLGSSTSDDMVFALRAINRRKRNFSPDELNLNSRSEISANEFYQKIDNFSQSTPDVSSNTILSRSFSDVGEVDPEIAKIFDSGKNQLN